MIISEPPKPIGRKQIITENPTVAAAKKMAIPYFEKLDNILTLPSPTLGFILDFQKIIPQNIIDRFKMGIINVHFSRLPQGRGPAPVQETILSGNKKAWITYYLITLKLDEGPVIRQNSLPLGLTETTDSLYQKLIEIASSKANTIIEEYLEGKLPPQPQAGSPSFTQKLTTENCRIDWKKTPEEIDRLIRAAYKEPGAWCTVKLDKEELTSEKRLKIMKAHLEYKKLILDEVQLEGKNPVSWQQFQEGYPNIEIIK